MKRFFLGLFLLLLVLSGCKQSAKDASVKATAGEKVIPVKVMELIPEDFTEYGEYYGTARGWQEARLICLGGGSVETIDVQDGEQVSKGTSLAVIDGEKATLAYETTQLHERIAYNNYLRQKQFFQNGNSSQLNVDQAHLAWLDSRSALLQAEKVKKGALCISPIDGQVVARYIEKNQELPAASPTFTVARMDRLLITVGIPETDMAGLEIGNEAEVFFAIYPNRVWKGSLISLNKEISRQDLSFRAQIRVDNPQGVILSGVTVRVKLKRKQLKDQIVIPSNALLINGKGSYAMVAEDNRVRQVFITPGPTNKTQTVVLNGLRSGNRLIVEGNHLVTENSIIRIVQ